LGIHWRAIWKASLRLLMEPGLIVYVATPPNIANANRLLSCGWFEP